MPQEKNETLKINHTISAPVQEAIKSMLAWARSPTAGIPPILLNDIDRETARLAAEGRDTKNIKAFRAELLDAAADVPDGPAAAAFVQALFLGLQIAGHVFASDEQRLRTLEAAVASARALSAAGGAKGAVTRRGKAEVWKRHARELAIELRPSTSSREKLAEEIHYSWRQEQPAAPSSRTLKKFVGELLDQRVIPPWA